MENLTLMEYEYWIPQGENAAPVEVALSLRAEDSTGQALMEYALHYTAQISEY